MPDRPTYRPVYKALHRPLTVWGVDRRLFFLSLLLGARDVQPLLLVPRRPAHVPAACTGLRCGRRHATRRCCGSYSLRRRRGDGTTPASTNACDMEVAPW